MRLADCHQIGGMNVTIDRNGSLAMGKKAEYGLIR